jgi:predicted ATPase/DNA-binding CsgD family transcriptional regulator
VTAIVAHPATVSLVGRDDELRRLRTLLGLPHTRVVTLTGIGGCGKTSLARAVVGAGSPGSAEAVVVELAGLRDPALVAPTVAAAVVTGDRPGLTPVDALGEALAGRPVLLVLDNCEHVRGATRDLVQELVTRSPDLRVLATSRVPLGVAGERRFEVPPLAVPRASGASVEALLAVASVRLFVDRATAADPTFELTPATAPTVARICERVEGLPLALELLAARISGAPVEELHGQLEAVLTRPGAGEANGPDGDLRPPVEWAYQLLEPAERLLLRRLSVFAGGWTRALTREVCGDGQLPADLVDRAHASLVAQGLVRPADPPGRYRLLEPVRIYAQQRLTPEEADASRQRFLEVYLDLVRRELPGRPWTSPPDTAGLGRLAVEDANLLAAIHQAGRAGRPVVALELVVRLWTYWRVRGRIALGRLLTERLLDDPSEAPATIVTDAMLAVASYAQTAGDLDRAEVRVGSVLARCRRLEDEHGYTIGLAVLANIATARGDHGRAVDLYQQAVVRAERLGSPYGRALVLTNLALAHVELGQLSEARTALTEADDLLTSVGDVWFRAYTLTCSSRLARRDGDLAREHELAMRSAELLAEHGGGPELAETIEHLADLEAAFGNAAVSAELHAAARHERETSGSPPTESQRAAGDARLEGLREALGSEVLARHLTARPPPTVAHALEQARAAVHRPPRPRRAGERASWPLTDRELDVANAVARGMTNKEIGRHLHISPATVKSHVERALAKLGFERRTELGVWATRRRGT